MQNTLKYYSSRDLCPTFSMCGKGHSFWLEVLNKAGHVQSIFLHLLRTAIQGLQVLTYTEKMKFLSIDRQRTPYCFWKLSLCAVYCVCVGYVLGYVCEEVFVCGGVGCVEVYVGECGVWGGGVCWGVCGGVCGVCGGRHVCVWGVETLFHSTVQASWLETHYIANTGFLFKLPSAG